MGLLSIEEIRKGLDKEFLPLEPMLSGFRLVKHELPEQLVVNVENQLSVTFPAKFREMIQSYDFGKLTIGPIAFCGTGDYLKELIESNVSVLWWGEGKRPHNLVMVANSDPFAILLDVNTGALLAMDAERGWQNSKIIAADFEEFLRGVGTVMLRRNEIADKETLAQAIVVAVGGQDLDFWYGLAR